MLFTKATEYALLSLVIISKEDKLQNADILSKKLGISKSFLAKVLQNLAKSEILVSYKGAHGGFALNKEPSEISIMSIVKCVEEKTPAVFDCSPSKDSCEGNANTCLIWPLLNNLQIKIDDFLTELTLESVINNN